MNESRWVAFVNRVRQEYNAPPATPRDEIWTRIEGSLGVGNVEPSEVGPAAPRRHAGVGYALAMIAASLLLWLGYGIGRASAPSPSLLQVVESGTTRAAVVTARTGERLPRSSTPGDAYGFATARLLASTGSLLTQVEDQAASGVLQPDAGAWARGLLTQTRLMLDSAADEGLRTLLEDLELTLMQVVTVSGAQESGDRDVGGFELRQLTNGMRESDLLPRIQRMLPPVIASDS